MIRFSHTHNSWQVYDPYSSLVPPFWRNISVQTARNLFDAGFDVITY